MTATFTVGTATVELRGVLMLLGVARGNAASIALGILRYRDSHVWLAQDDDGWWKLFTNKPEFAHAETIFGRKQVNHGIWTMPVTPNGYRKLIHKSDTMPDNDILTYDTSTWRATE